MGQLKGIDTIQWTFISVLIALLLVTFAVSPLQMSIDEAVRSSDKMIVQQLVSAINYVETAPQNTTYTIIFPARGRNSCTLSISNGIVYLRFTEGEKITNTFANFILTDVPVGTSDNQPINCLAGTLTIHKVGNSVNVGI